MIPTILAEIERKQEALVSVRRLVRAGNNKSYWRKREQALLTEIDRLAGDGE